MRRLAVLAAVAATGFVPASANAQVIEIGHIPQCSQALPGFLGLSRTPVSIDVRVLLDGVSQSRAQAIVADANRAYAPEGLTLRASYQVVLFSQTDSARMIGEAKAAVGGLRPPGVDLVYGLTSKDMSGGNESAVAGEADCIGGVAFSDRAFAVGEDVGIERFSILGVEFLRDLGAKVLAHELGHLLGAHHHYANCAEALVPSLLEARGEPCTLMFNDLGLQRLQFGGTNATVVRGHAQRYAR